MINKMTKASLGLVIALLTFSGLLAAGAYVASQPPSPVARLKQALRFARFGGSGYPQYGPNPYGPTLQILKRYGNRIPAIWQARALTRYGDMLLMPYGIQYPTKAIAAEYHQKAERLILRAVTICPSYTNGWVSAATEHFCRGTKSDYKIGDKYLAIAYRTDSRSPLVQGWRAYRIIDRHGGHGMKAGVFTGNLGFRSAKWRRAFCYRALLCLEYLKHSPISRNNAYLLNLLNEWKRFYATALKYYDPKDLALLDAGVWKPGKCPDPWPPAEKKPSAASQPALGAKKSP